MKALIFEQFGGPEVLQYVDIPAQLRARPYPNLINPLTGEKAAEYGSNVLSALLGLRIL